MHTFVVSANTVCALGSKALEAVAGRVAGIEDPDEVAAILARDFVPAVRSTMGDLRALPTPAEVADEMGAAMAEIEVVLTLIEEDPVENFLLADADPFATANRQFREIGLYVCAGDAVPR